MPRCLVPQVEALSGVPHQSLSVAPQNLEEISHQGLPTGPPNSGNLAGLPARARLQMEGENHQSPRRSREDWALLKAGQGPGEDSPTLVDSY